MKNFLHTRNMAIVITGLGVLFIGLGGSTSARMQAFPAGSQQLPMLSDTMDSLPNIPSSQIVEDHVSDPALSYPAFRRVKYEVDTTSPDVLDFYNRVLPDLGWSLLHATPFPYYTWTDPSGKLPWHQDLSIYPEVAEGKLIVTLVISWWPEIEKLPVYSDAIELTSATEEEEQAEVRKRTIRTSYLTSSSIEEIKQYYLSVLPEHGWHVKGGRDLLGSEMGLRFSATHRSLDNKVIGMDLLLNFQPSNGGGNSVELVVTETEAKVNW